MKTNADLHAEIAIQNQMIDGARKAASRMMCEITEMKAALSNIANRGMVHGPLNSFQQCQQIARDTLYECEKIAAKI